MNRSDRGTIPPIDATPDDVKPMAPIPPPQRTTSPETPRARRDTAQQVPVVERVRHEEVTVPSGRRLDHERKLWSAIIALSVACLIMTIGGAILLARHNNNVDRIDRLERAAGEHALTHKVP